MDSCTHCLGYASPRETTRTCYAKVYLVLFLSSSSIGTSIIINNSDILTLLVVVPAVIIVNIFVVLFVLSLSAVACGCP